MPLTLPDTANLGDPGHITDHNLLQVAVGSLESQLAAKAALASPAFTGTPTLGGVPWGLPGLTYITKLDFAAASSIIVNGCFTSTFDDYLILVEATASAGQVLNMRLRAAGVDAATNYNYATALMEAAYSGSQVPGATQLWAGRIGTAKGHIEISAAGPAVAAVTTFMTRAHWDAAGAVRVELIHGNHTTATAYDGFTLTPNVGTATGTVRVYGYKNS